MTNHFIRFITFFYLLLINVFSSQAQDNCALYTQAALQKLPNLLIENNFDQIESINNTIITTCGETELVFRLRILALIIQKKIATPLIKTYQDLGFDEVLVKRFDQAAEKKYNTIYAKNPESFDFIPLRHAVDSLLRVKAAALLNSTSFGLNAQETAICFLFADDIEEYYRISKRQSPYSGKTEKSKNRTSGKDEISAAVYGGSFMPLNSNAYQKTAPVFGVSVMSPLSKAFVFEFLLKMRVHANNDPFQFIHEGEIRNISPSTSFLLGLSAGKKILDKGAWIILPKIGAGLGFINTRLSKTTLYDVIITDEEEALAYNNVNTLHSFAGITFMRHLRKRMFIGLETSYHHLPYNWDSDLITHIDNQFASVELFFRF